MTLRDDCCYYCFCSSSKFFTILPTICPYNMLLIHIKDLHALSQVETRCFRNLQGRGGNTSVILVCMEDNLLMHPYRHILRQVKGNQSQTNHRQSCVRKHFFDRHIHRCTKLTTNSSICMFLCSVCHGFRTMNWNFFESFQTTFEASVIF